MSNTPESAGNTDRICSRLAAIALLEGRWGKAAMQETSEKHPVLKGIAFMVP